jgi:folate-binding Fe-S cluster repair protein YgfZ
MIQALKGISQSCGLDGSAESTLKWIGSLKENYIMIFDNADVLSPPALEVYFPPGMRGNILITSRNSAMMTLTSPKNSLEVTEMEQREAIELFLKASCLESPTLDVQIQASKIAMELFCFPLAIDQAGAYIASGAATIGDYLAQYSEHQKTLLSHSEFTGASKYNRTVYETWELSYKEIQQRAKSNDSYKANAANSAMLLLELFPFFHHEGITEEIFSYAALQEDDKTLILNLPFASSLLDQRLLPLCETGTWDNFIFREGIQILLAFSLIRRGPSDNVYAMHPLVHTWGRDRLTLNEREKCCLMAYVTLSCSLRWDAGQPYGFQRTLVTHVRAIMEYFKSKDNQNIISYMDDANTKFGRLLREQGYAKEAETLEIKVLNKRNKILGVEHPDTINAMASLASTNVDLGKYKEAEKLEIQVLDARKRILGVEHTETIRAMGNLASTYGNQGKYKEAEKLEIQVLDARKRIFGVEHPHTIDAMANIAVTYGNLGKYTESEKLEIQVLDARKRILGMEHPDTIVDMENLAVTYGDLGKYKEAEKLNIQVLDARNRILGVEHPDTITAMGNLASTYGNQGTYKEAEKLEIQVLDTRKRILGVEHPETIRAMSNLAVTYGNLGKYRESEKLEIQVLDARKRVLEVEHPDTIFAMENLAVTYTNLREYKEAEELDIQVLDARNRILGVEHPDTIRAMANLGSTHRNQRRYKEAEKLEIQVLDARNRILGVKHPETITAMANLASTYGIQRRYKEAEKLEIQALDARKRILGVQHPHTILAMENLAGTLRSLGQYKEAKKLDIQAQKVKSRVIGATSQHAIATMANVQEAQETSIVYSDKKGV